MQRGEEGRNLSKGELMEKMRKEREMRQLEKVKVSSASLLQRYTRSLGVKQKEHKKLAIEENVVNIINEIVKVINL